MITEVSKTSQPSSILGRPARKENMAFKRLNHRNRHTFFKQKFFHNEVCTYDQGWFLFSDVRRLASNDSVSLEYIDNVRYPSLYLEVNSYGFMIKLPASEVKLKEPPEPLLFDINELVH